MKKCTLRGLALLSFAAIGAQQPLFEKQLPQDFKIKNSLQIGHMGDHSMSLLFMDNKRSMASLINGDLVESATFQTDPLPKKYNIPLGAQG